MLLAKTVGAHRGKKLPGNTSQQTSALDLHRAAQRCTHLPIVWITDERVRKQKSWRRGDGREERTNEDSQIK